MSTEDTQQKAFFTRMMPGIKKSNLAAFYYVAFITICLASLINMLQPFMLSAFLGLPTDSHGVPTGQLAFAGEVVILSLVAAFGIMSDRVGRRFIYGLGLFIIGIGFAITPLSRSLDMLLFTRCIYAIGAAAATSMLAIVVADYVIDEDRGKATGIMGFMNGLGAMISALLLVKVPAWLTNGGIDTISAGWYTYGGMAVVAVLSAVVAWTMLSGIKVRKSEQEQEEKLSFVEGTKVGIVAAKDPGIALSYAASFVARPDLALIALFFPLWVSKYGQEALNMSAEEGIAAAGPILACCFGASLFFAPVIGIISDRFNRVGALAFGLGLNTLGYGLTYFIADPTAGVMMGVMVIIGMGQVSGVITSQVLIQQQAPASRRGSIIGTFGFMGALGIMVCSYIGGVLFDGVGPWGPFVMLAVLNGAVALWALTLIKKVKAPAESTGTLLPEAPATYEAAQSEVA